MSIWILTLIILVIAIFMTMTSHAGGNFFVIALVLSGIEMHITATTGQFILFTASFFALIVFGKKKYVELKLAVFIGILIAFSAFSGGFFSDYISGKILKIILSFILFFIALLMLKPVNTDINKGIKTDWRYMNMKADNGNDVYTINLLLIIPLILGFGFVAGMVGISGGSFLVPLLVLSCGVPMKNAVGTASMLIAVSALTGFIGHTLSGHFNYRIAVPVAIGGAIEGLIGSSIAIKTKPGTLKILFALTTLAGAVVMIINALN